MPRKRKLTDAQVASIRERKAAGESVRALAAELLVNESCISKILSGVNRSGVRTSPWRGRAVLPSAPSLRGRE